MSGGWQSRRARHRGAALFAAALLAGAGALAQPAPLSVCVAEDNPPLSHRVGGQMRGLDVRIAEAAAAALGRVLRPVPFESEYEKESTLAQEVAALLSSGVCEAASGFPLIAGDLGPPARPTARTPDYPGARRFRDRPFVTLAPLAASRAYQSVTLGLVAAAGAAPPQGLADLGERRLGVTSGTVAGAVAMGWRHGKLRRQLVSLGQHEQPLDALAQAGGTGFDVLLLPTALFDGWRLRHPGSTLVAADWRRPIGINLGFVTLAGDSAVRAALDRVISEARSDGRLARWAAEEGVSWTAPGLPEVSRGPSLADLAAD